MYNINNVTLLNVGLIKMLLVATLESYLWELTADSNNKTKRLWAFEASINLETH